jgi:O-antigen/teichoic acid export membrane protein
MSVRRSLIWSYGAQAVIFVSTFGSSVIVARILGPYEMGIFAIAMAIGGVLSILSAFGVGPYLVRHTELDRATISAIFTVNAILSLVVALAILIAAVAVPLFGVNGNVRNVLILLALLPVIGIFEFLPLSFLQREMDFRVISLIGMCRAIINSAAVVGFALTGFGALSPALAMVSAAIFSMCTFNVVGHRHASFRVGLTNWREIAKFGFQMMSVGGIATVAQRLSEISLGRILGLSALGIYGRAAGLSNQIWDNVYGLATRVIFSQMAEEMRQSETVARTFLGGLAILTALIWPLLMGIAALSGPMIYLLYGERWLAAAAPLSVLMCAHLIALGFGMNWELCVLTKRTGWQAKIEALRAAAGLSSFVIGAFFGLVTAALGRVVDALVGLVSYGPKMREMAGTTKGQISRVYKQSTALTVLAVGPAAGVMQWNDWSYRAPLLSIGIAIVLGITLWLAALCLFAHPLWGEIKRVVARLTMQTRQEIR